MKIQHLFVFGCFLILTHTTVFSDGFFKWKDAHGNTQYGDRPPANVKAKKIAMPAITVIDNYADQWKPLELDKPANNISNQSSLKTTSADDKYSKLEFIAPKANQAIRANDGDVSVMLSIKPPLKAGHEIAFSLDGKEVSRGSVRTNNFSNLPRGVHNVTAKIVDKNGKVIKANSVSFNVLRFSKLSDSGVPQNTEADGNSDVRTAGQRVKKVISYNQARQNNK